MLDTSVAVKWYLPEELHDEAISLLRRAETGDVELLAPVTASRRSEPVFNLLMNSRSSNRPPTNVQMYRNRAGTDQYPAAKLSPSRLQNT